MQYQHTQEVAQKTLQVGRSGEFQQLSICFKRDLWDSQKALTLQMPHRNTWALRHNGIFASWK